MNEDRFLTDEQIAAEGITPDQLENPSEPIDLDYTQVFCPRHGQPFREDWPKGYIVASLELLKEVMNSETFQKLTDGQVSMINSLLRARPLCERVSAATLLRVYIVAGIGRERRCELCRDRGLGTSFNMGRPNGQVVSYRHVCFNCVIYRLQPAH